MVRTCMAFGCLKQTNNKPRQSERSSSSARRKSSEEQDKVKSFADFIVNMKKKYPKFHFIEENGSLSMFRTDELGHEVINFLQFIEVESPFGFLKLVLAEHKVYKNQLGVPRNSLISKWSLVYSIMKTLWEYQPSNNGYLQKALESLNCMDNLVNYQSLHEQLEL